MRILIISPSNTFPALSGGAVRTNALLKYLAKENKVFYVYNKYHQVKEAIGGKIKSKASINNAKTYPIGPTIRVAQLFNPLLLMKAYKIIKKQKIDLVIGEFAWSGIYLLLLKFLTKIPYVIDEHNIEYRLVNFNYGIIGKLIHPSVKFYERITWKFSKYIFCVSENDRNTIINCGVDHKKVVVVQNGMDYGFSTKINKKKIREKLNLNPDDLIILFFGKLDYYPNKEAVYIIYKEILPRILRKKKDIKFLIVGSNPPEVNHENIIFTGPVESIKNCIVASDIVINPLLHGTGTRFKILEAVALGKVVISTSIGAGELTNGNLKDVLIIKDDWDGFTEEIIKNISIKGKMPQKEFFEIYSWENILDCVNKIIQTV